MKVNRIIAIALSAIMMMTLLCSHPFANELPMPRASTDIFYTPQMTAGKEWSGLAADKVHYLACNKDSLTGEDFDIDFYYTGVGLSNDYVWDLSRTGLVTVKDDDPGPNPNEVLFTLTGTFAINNGKYRMCEWSTRYNINTEEVEDNNNIELYILVEIQTKPNDKSTNVPKDFLAYRFVTTY